jgi:adenosylmethionine---8-amino-7-oxononanoate aminotransferase
MAKTPFLEQPDRLIDRDRTSIWHPFTQAATAAAPLCIERAKEARLYTSDGKEVIDAISSWWVTLHGHGHPHIVEAITRQLHRLEQVMFADCTHTPAVAFAEKLLALLPKHFSRIFYSDNGSTAVETALKMAFQYWFNEDPATKRKKVISFNEGYHGDTLGAMSVSAKGPFASPFLHALFDVLYIDPPRIGKEEESLRQLKACLSDEIACFIFEPVQGVAGMKVLSKEGIDSCLELCHACDVITIADEVLTGFGRTGPHFAIEQLRNPPEIICLSKGITGGFLPLAVTACTEKIYERFLAHERSKAFLHGHSYCGNPLACAAGVASLELLATESCAQQRERIQRAHERFLKRWEGHPKIVYSHVTGTILAISYKTQEGASYYNSLREKLLSHFRSRLILMRPLGNTIHVLPPYCITEQELDTIYAAIEETLVGDL